MMTGLPRKEGTTQTDGVFIRAGRLESQGSGGGAQFCGHSTCEAKEAEWRVPIQPRILRETVFKWGRGRSRRKKRGREEEEREAMAGKVTGIRTHQRSDC